MTGHSKRPTFQVAWSDHDGAYVGTAVEFGSLSHRSPTAQGALAGIERLVAQALDGRDADDDPATHTMCAVACLICAKAMPASTPNSTEPLGGVTVHIFGNYGSAVFDPTDGATSWLQAALCDTCFASAITAQRVLQVTRSHTPAPPPTYRIATGETIQKL